LRTAVSPSEGQFHFWRFGVGLLIR
jgi:hypothetical protein